jgi:glycine/D-amino acid oxidase-like deaminating enzyme
VPEEGFRASLWYASAGAPPQTRKLAGDTAADVAIVGAGYCGLACALALAERGARAVVLEAEDIGYGASGRNNGQVIPTLSRIEPEALREKKGERFVRLVAASAALTFDLIRRHSLQCEAVQSGWVQPAHTRGRLGLAEARADAWRRYGAAAELLDRAAVERITGSRSWYGGWQDRTGGKLNPLSFARELARAAIGRGARIYSSSRVLSIHKKKTWELRTALGTVRAERVVIATHAYTEDLWPALGRSVVPLASYQMATAPLAHPESVLPFDHACSDTRGDLFFFRKDAAGRLITGGALVAHWNWRARLERLIAERVARVFPQLGRPRFEYLWHGALGMTADGAPHAYELAPGVLAWGGCNGRGLALAVAVGAELARASLGEKDLAVPLVSPRPLPGPAYAIARRIRPAALLLARWRDARELA